jgi:hypothetical protein
MRRGADKQSAKKSGMCITTLAKAWMSCFAMGMWKPRFATSRQSELDPKWASLADAYCAISWVRRHGAPAMRDADGIAPQASQAAHGRLRGSIYVFGV